MQVYVGQSGDTLSSIAESFGISVEALTEANPFFLFNPFFLLGSAFINPDLIHPGILLCVPEGPDVPAPPTQVYVVPKCDNKPVQHALHLRHHDCAAACGAVDRGSRASLAAGVGNGNGASASTSEKSSGSTLPRNVVHTLSEVEEILPEMSQETATGRDATAPAFLHALIHRSAWKRSSRKSISTILHIGGPTGPETPDSPGPVPNPKPYMLWWCIKMRVRE